MSLRAFDLPDPAKLRPQDPLSDVAIISYSRKDIEKVTKKENCWVSEQEGMLDVVRTSAKPKRGMTDYYKKRRDDQLQEKLNRLLESAKHWSTEKEAKASHSDSCLLQLLYTIGIRSATCSRVTTVQLIEIKCFM